MQETEVSVNTDIGSKSTLFLRPGDGTNILYFFRLKGVLFEWVSLISLYLLYSDCLILHLLGVPMYVSEYNKMRLLHVVKVVVACGTCFGLSDIFTVKAVSQ